MLDYLMLANAQGNGGGSPMGMILFIGAIFAIFYFLILRPQKKRDQARREMLSRVKKGSEVVTTGGIHGRVTSVKEDEVIIEVDPKNNLSLRMSRSSIARVLSGSTEEADGSGSEE